MNTEEKPSARTEQKNRHLLGHAGYRKRGGNARLQHMTWIEAE